MVNGIWRVVSGEWRRVNVVAYTPTTHPHHSSTPPTSVESSMRLDAVASAGMKLSRSKLAKMVKEGMVEVNFVKETNRSGRNRNPRREPVANPPPTRRELTRS